MGVSIYYILSQMIAETLKALVETLKLAPRYIFALCIISATLLFAPSSIISHLGLVEAIAQYRSWLGITFVISLVLYLVHLAVMIFGLLSKWNRKRRSELRTIDRLKNLTEEEKQILRYYFARDTRSNTLRLDNGCVQRLASAGIIYRASNLGNLVEGFTFNITDLAWNFLFVNPEFLHGSTNFYSTDRKERSLDGF